MSITQEDYDRLLEVHYQLIDERNALIKRVEEIAKRHDDMGHALNSANRTICRLQFRLAQLTSEGAEIDECVDERDDSEGSDETT